MPARLKNTLGMKIILSALVGVIGFIAIAVLAYNVAGQMRQLNTANTDNVQWSLAQAEVDFLEFSAFVAQAPDLIAASPELRPEILAEVRRGFDVFYSRIDTLDKSTVYRPLRATRGFSADLLTIQNFLERSVTVIDASDDIMNVALPDLAASAEKLRPSIRNLAHTGLTFFAQVADERRNAISVTLFQLAAGVAFLLITMFTLAIYLATLNRQNIQRRAEVIEASERMKTITDTALDAVIVSDRMGQILTFNAAAEQIFGYTAKEAIGQDLGALLIPDHLRAAHRAGMERMRRGGARQIVGKGRVRLESMRANGELFPSEFAIQSAETADGEIFIAFLRDISVRVRAEEELVHARDRALAGEKAKTDFLATMSHEIRTPLNGLMGSLALLEDTDLTPRQARYIKHMNTSGRLLLRHITDVLDLTKYDAGKLLIRPEPMDIGLLIQDIVDNQGGMAATNQTVLSWGWVGEPTPWINADHDRMQHILMNIVGNAVKFTRDGAVRVEVGVTPADEAQPNPIPQMWITVTDTGIGMDADLQSRIFDDFTTGNSAYDRSVGGTGLGLGIAKRFIMALGGTVDVESKVGEGSRFTLRFPIEPVPDHEIPQAVAPRDSSMVLREDPSLAKTEDANDDIRVVRQQPQTPAGPSRDILVVEDNSINRVVAREMLRACGHTVTEVHNGQEAVDITQTRRFDLILMDISMPVMDGRTATRAIRASAGLNATTPIIALTANAMAEERKAYLQDGMNDILTKPLMRAGLTQVIDTFVVREEAAPAAAPADQPAAPKRPDIINSTHIDELRDVLGAEMLKSLLNRHCAEIETVLTQLHDDETLETEEIAARAHKIAGSAAALGAVKLRAGLIAVERAARADQDSTMFEAIDALPGIWEETKPALFAEV
ncbi:ATP-binding protein [Albirhodobacter sp. R86504]|uniref:hybrid sensor histidine kinase/response regulator n=1 Tax=Albirhodobacter sp. R86504 TaxID=3093848 RepID=UPI00366DD1D8